MKTPEGMEKFSRAELLIALPHDWPLTEAAFKDEASYWPVRWLKMIGRLPHEYETWIGGLCSTSTAQTSPRGRAGSGEPRPITDRATWK